MRTMTGSRRPPPAATGWLPSALTGPFATVANFHILIALLAVCALGGGSSFADVLSLLVVRPVAVVALVAGLLVPVAADWRTFRAPAIGLGLLAALIALQLVPLPPAVWTALPGRAPYVPVAGLIGAAPLWRPLSLTPDLTLNALAALIVPAAVLANFVKLRADQRRATVIALIVLCCASVALGVAQFAGGRDSALYLYQRTYEGFPVGFLANRNHHATLLALAFPALRVWTLGATPDRAWAARRTWLALGIGILILPVVLATGSRAGMALAVLSIAATFVLLPARRDPGASAASARRAALLRLAIPAALVLLVVLTYAFGRAASIDRLIGLADVDADFRFRFAPVMFDIIRDTFPVGTGFGGFDPIFRQYEPDAILKSSYFNHAHNELIELAIMAGLPGLLLLAGFVGWVILRTIATLRAAGGVDTAQRMVRLGILSTVVILSASLVDYPLRAPLMAFVFTLAACWMCEGRAAGNVAVPRERG